MANNVITQARFRGGVAYEYDGLTFETTVSSAPFAFGDEFVGAGHQAGIPAAGLPVAGYPWVKKIVGSGPPTALIPSSAAGGQLQVALAATSEAEEASVYFNDSLSIPTVGTSTGQAEWRANLGVAPASGAQAFIGLGSPWVGGPLNLARYIGFLWNGSAALSIVSKDGNGDTYNFGAAQIGGSAIVTDTTGFHIYCVDWSNQADVRFYVDGNPVNAPNTVVWNPSSAANGLLQPWHTVYKPSGAGLATLNIDKIDAFVNR